MIPESAPRVRRWRHPLLYAAARIRGLMGTFLGCWHANSQPPLCRRKGVCWRGCLRSRADRVPGDGPCFSGDAADRYFSFLFRSRVMARR